MPAGLPTSPGAFSAPAGTARVWGERTTAVLVPTCVWGTVLAVPLIVAFVASPLGHGPQKHADGSSHQLTMRCSRTGG